MTEDVAGAKGFSGVAASENGATRRKFAQQRVAGDGAGQVMRNREPIVCQCYGRGQHFTQWQDAICLVSIEPGVEQAGHGDTQDSLHGNSLPVSLQSGRVGGRSGAVAYAEAVIFRAIGHDEPIAADA